MRRIIISKRSKQRLTHIEAPGCIVNIRHGLTDEAGRAVTAIEVLADGPDGCGGGTWKIADGSRCHNVRVLGPNIEC